MNVFRKMPMEDIIVELLKGVESTDDGVREIKSNLSTMSQLVYSYSTTIKHLDQKMSQLSIAFNQRKRETLPSDTV